MSKITIEQVEETLLRQKVDQQVVKTVLKELEEVVQEEKAEKIEGAAPKAKNEFLFVLLDPNNEFAGKELVGWVVTQKAGEDPGMLLEKIRQSAFDTNAGKKRKKNLIDSMVAAFEGIKRKFLKEKNVAIKTKEAVRVLVTDGKL